MHEARVVFEFTSFWHMGTGSARGFALDAVVARDARGLPIIPGRTVKGLLREAVTLLGECEASEVPDTTLEQLFGRTNGPSESRYDGSSGSLVFSSATLDPDPTLDPEWNAALASHLFGAVASTSLDEHGVAAQHTLRRIEVTVPLRLSAVVSTRDEPDDAWVQLLQRAAPLLRSVGSHRHRGLGRVTVTVLANYDGGVS